MSRMSDQPVTQQKRGPAVFERPPADPARLLPREARPITLAIVLAAVHLLGATVTGLTLIGSAYQHAPEGILLWTIAWLVVGAPASVVVAFAGWRAEAVLSASWPLARWWIPLGIGLVAVAHWLPLCLWSPALAVGILVDPGDLERLLAGMAVAVAPWILTTAGLGLVVVAVRRLEQREWKGYARLPPGPSVVPTSTVAAASYGLAIAMPALVWLVWVEQSAWERAGTLSLWAWIALGFAAAALAGGLTGGFVERTSLLSPRLAEQVRVRQIEVAGAVLAVHWLPMFLLTLNSQLVDDPDPRFTFLFVAFLVVSAGTAAASIARTVRVTGGSDAVS
jgi:hypothetical protein